MGKQIKVLVVDDSSLIRSMLSSILDADPDINVVGVAEDPMDARTKIKALNPDVITLDIEMPKMDGISFLEKIMSLRPMPVVMVSTLTQDGAEATIRALEIGAVEYVPKPTGGEHEAKAIAEELVLKVKAAATANIAAIPAVKPAAKPAPAASATKAVEFTPTPKAQRTIIAIGSSTGGVEALRDIVTALPANFPPVLITQHMPKGFTASFAKRLDSMSAVTVTEASHGDPVRAGHVYIAPGGQHLEIMPSEKSGYMCKVFDGELVSGHRPSVDVLFASFAKHVGKQAIGVILTGMGKDGAKSLLLMRKAGAYTLGQDEKSSIVYGMPKAAFDLGAVEKQMPLNKVVDGMCSYLIG